MSVRINFPRSKGRVAVRVSNFRGNSLLPLSIELHEVMLTLCGPSMSATHQKEVELVVPPRNIQLSVFVVMSVIEHSPSARHVYDEQPVMRFYVFV